MGTGAARGFLSVYDTAWLMRSWSAGEMSPLQCIAEKEEIYQRLVQCTPGSLKPPSHHTIDPCTRYINKKPQFIFQAFLFPCWACLINFTPLGCLSAKFRVYVDPFGPGAISPSG